MSDARKKVADALLPPPQGYLPDWWNKGVGEVANAFGRIVAMPRRAMERGVTTEEAIPWAADTAMNLAGVGTPMAASGAAGIFGGRLAATADKAALAKAESMAAQGASRDEILGQTKWFQDNGAWWTELPDTGLTTRLGRGKGIGPNSPISHPVVAENYGHLPATVPLDNMEVLSRIGPQSGQYGGLFNPAPLGISVAGMSNEARRGMAAHELQHLIQSREGFKNNPPNPTSDYRGYQNDWRERQARNAEIRLGMSEAERRAIPPWDTMPPERGWHINDTLARHPVASGLTMGGAPLGAFLAADRMIPDEKVEEWKRLREERRKRPPAGPDEWPNDPRVSAFLRRVAPAGAWEGRISGLGGMTP